VVPPSSSSAALPSISLPAGVQAMVMTSSGMAVASPSQWPPAAQAALQLADATGGPPAACGVCGGDLTVADLRPLF
jgi:hypothetical protein